MTRLAVSILVQSLEHGLCAAARAAELGAELVEFRLDHFPGKVPQAPAQAMALVRRAPLPCIISCRPTWEGGHFAGDEAERLAIFDAVCQSSNPPAYIDIELAAYQRSSPWRRHVARWVDHPGSPRPAGTGLILSSHDFHGRPVDLYQRLEAIAATTECRAIKVVWQARSLRDNLEAFEIISQRHKPTIALCMGEFGLLSRVLAKKFGALLTFAALDAGRETAPGQPTIEQLKSLYRWDHLNAQTHVYGVIGHPLGHSMSPAIHNAGFDHTGYNGVYFPLPIAPEYEPFKATVATLLAMPELHFRGASVTIPHKENLLRFVGECGGEIEPLAQRIGAANTLTVREDGSLYASNTDYAAALDAICEPLDIAREALRGRRVAVIGAGGAARAMVAGLAAYGATVVIYNRTLDKAAALAEQFNSAEAKVVPAPLEKLCDSCCEVFINCTPIGMHPRVDNTPIPRFPTAHGKSSGTSRPVVFDTIYNPPVTRLLREAQAAGCVTISGVEMFVRQAAAQFEQWTHQPAPRALFRQVLRQRLAQ